MKAKKIASLLLAAALLVTTSIAGTVAYLTSKTEDVVNTFTVGKVVITLDEAKVDVYGVKDGETRVTANEYKLIPGHTYVKDPTVHVQKNSEECYVFVKMNKSELERGLEADPTTDRSYTPIRRQILGNGWKDLKTKDTENYVLYKAVDAETAKAGTNLVLFNNFKVRTDAEFRENENYDIKVTAYAVQQDGLTVEQAWEVAKGIK